jgi:hypothetical protein
MITKMSPKMFHHPTFSLENYICDVEITKTRNRSEAFELQNDKHAAIV